MPEDTDRVTVSTYVPAHQRDVWREDAESLGMSQSEFVRTMVQAGRRGFSLDGETSNPVEHDPPGSNPRGNGLKATVLELLREEGSLGWSDIVDGVIGDVEGDLESTLLELQEENRIHHSPRNATYSLVEERDGE